MSWEFLDIFKKADFNKLMLALAATGWLVFWLSLVPEPTKYYILWFAIFASFYCLSGLTVFFYNQIKTKKQNNRQIKKRELYIKKIEAEKKIEIFRMFDGLTKENKEALAYILKQGKVDKYQQNVFHYGKGDFYQTDCFFQAQSNTRIYRTDDPRVFSYNSENGQPCIAINNYTNTITLTIEPYLLDLIRKYIDE